MEITSRLLSSRDLLEMGMTSIEYIAPSIRECYLSIQKYPDYNENFDGIKIMQGWNNKLFAMKATDELSEEDIKQLKFDLGNVFEDFSRIVNQ